VLSFPFQLRWALAFHHELVLSLARITQAEIVRRYRLLGTRSRVVARLIVRTDTVQGSTWGSCCDLLRV
jgi:hypothetical protein